MSVLLYSGIFGDRTKKDKLIYTTNKDYEQNYRFCRIKKSLDATWFE